MLPSNIRTNTRTSIFRLLQLSSHLSNLMIVSVNFCCYINEGETRRKLAWDRDLKILCWLLGNGGVLSKRMQVSFTICNRRWNAFSSGASCKWGCALRTWCLSAQSSRKSAPKLWAVPGGPLRGQEDMWSRVWQSHLRPCYISLQLTEALVY